jgi:hypothetical protein
MNPKTTVALVLIVLAAAGAYAWLNQDAPPADPASRRLFPGLAPDDVRALKYGGGGDDGLVLERRADGFYVSRPGHPVRRAKNELMEAALRAVASSAFLAPRGDVRPEDDAGFGLAPAHRRIVTVVATDGRETSLVVGAPVRAGVVVARQGGPAGPAVEIDSVLVADLFPGGATLVDPRLLPWYAPSVNGLRVFDRADGGPAFGAVRQSGRWFLREPAAVRAEQSAVDGIAAYLCSVEAAGPYEGPPPETVVRARLEFREGSAASIACARLPNGRAAARTEPDGAWEYVDEVLLERLLVDPLSLRTRRLTDVEAGRIVELRWQDGDAPVERIARMGETFVFLAPESFGWKVPAHLAQGADPASRPTAPFMLDPAAALRLVEGVGDLAAVAFPGTPPESVECRLTVVAAADAGGALRSEKTLEFGPVRDGRRLVRSSDGTLAAVRAADVDFLRRPFYSRLVRMAASTLPHCILAAEIKTAAGRVITLRASEVADGKLRFDRTDSEKPDRPLRLDATTCDPLRHKLAALTVKDYVAYGRRPEFGLDRPHLVVRWRDTVQKYEGRPELEAPGEWLEWRVGAEAGDGTRYGEVSTFPGLVFRTEPADLGPVLDFLNQ